MTTIKKVYIADYGYDLNFSIKDSSGDAIDLTSATSIALKVIKKDSRIVKFTGACTVDVAASGTCHYSVVTTDFNEAGIFEYQLQITTASSVVTCIPQEEIEVLRRL